MTDVTDKFVLKMRTHFVGNNLFPKSCHYEIMLKNMFRLDKLQVTV